MENKPTFRSRVTQRDVPTLAIIGSGISGLAAANALSDVADITIFEKSRGVGGRLATRYADEYEFDHGAQYFTMKDPRFIAAMSPLIDAGLVKPWVTAMRSGKLFRTDSREKWVGAPRMNVIGKTLAEGLTIRHERIAQITQTWGGWRLMTDQGYPREFFDWVIFAIPADQAAPIIPDTIKFKHDIDAAPLRPAFTVMLGMPAVWTTPWQAASYVKTDSSILSWISINSSKPGRRKGVTSIVIQSDHDFAAQRIDDDRDAVMQDMINEAGKTCGIDVGRANHAVIHRWLYANPGPVAGRDYLMDKPAKIAAIGDWCIAGRVESAYLSGAACAQTIRETLKTSAKPN